MRNSVAAFAVLCLLAACDGNPLGFGITAEPPDPDDPVTDPVVDPTDPVADPDTTAEGVPLTVAVNLQSVTYNPGSNTISVTIDSLDGTPTAATFIQDPAFPVGVGLPAGYEAYFLQEDPLDRFFVAVARESFDGSVQGAIAADGGQFNREFHGGWFTRNGEFTPPAIGNGPGQGQVSYAGAYVGLDDVTGPAFALPAGADPSLQMAGPGRVVGNAFINANFADMSLNGAVYDRTLIDTVGPATRPDLFLIVADIDGDGRFEGIVEQTRIDPGTGDIIIEEVGTYAGLFGGASASSVAASLVIENFDPDLTNETETGLFVLNQCGTAGEDPILCNGTAP